MRRLDEIKEYRINVDTLEIGMEVGIGLYESYDWNSSFPIVKAGIIKKLTPKRTKLTITFNDNRTEEYKTNEVNFYKINEEINNFNNANNKRYFVYAFFKNNEGLRKLFSRTHGFITNSKNHQEWESDFKDFIINKANDSIVEELNKSILILKKMLIDIEID